MSDDDSQFDVFEYQGSEEADEYEGWQEVAVGEYTLLLPLSCVHIWDSSAMLAEWIVNHPSSVHGERVLELGCGLGLPSFAAALVGAKEVVATDLSPQAVAQIVKAVEYNSETYPQLSILSASVLDWFSPETTMKPFSCIIAADVNYERCLTTPLTNTVLSYLADAAPLYLATRSGRVSLNDSLTSLSTNLTLTDTSDLHISEDKHHLLYRFQRQSVEGDRRE